MNKKTIKSVLFSIFLLGSIIVGGIFLVKHFTSQNEAGQNIKVKENIKEVDVIEAKKPSTTTEEETISSAKEVLGDNYTKDENYIYYEDKIIENADPKTFEIIRDDYAKDKNNVYYQGVIKEEADSVNCAKNNLRGCFTKQKFLEESDTYELEVDWLDEPEHLEERGEYEFSSGVVTNGKFKGGKLIVREKYFEEGIFWKIGLDSIIHLVYFDETEFFVKNGDFSIKNFLLDFPDEIAIPGSDYILKEGLIERTLFPDKKEEYTVLFSDKIAGNIFTEDNRFYVKRLDHVLIEYTLQLPFINEGNGEIKINLLDGAGHSEEYEYTSGWSCLSVVDDETFNPKKRLIKVGEADNGDEFYTLADDQDQWFIDLYNDNNTIASYSGSNKYTYNEFLSFYPLLYWSDPFGRWIEFKNERFLPAVEMAKPVIYLYPKEKVTLDVFVEPNGGFTQTIPEYEDGWHVEVHPDGKIIDLKTNKEYPYLFWEGLGIMIPKITQGWIVARENTETFFTEKLTILGLNKKEISDFNKYWVPRLRGEGAQYYKIMFLDQKEFDRLAPLSIGGANPDNVIRVMMFAQAAEISDELPEQILQFSPRRGGFTVVEWGGAVLK